jgi:hypothetical protein
MSSQRLLTASEAAAVAGVTRQTLHNWMHGGLVDGVRMGRWWFVTPASLSACLRNRRGSEPGTSTGVTYHADVNSTESRAFLQSQQAAA